MAAKILGNVPVSELHAGDKILTKAGTWGYIDGIYHDDGLEGDYLLHQGFQIFLKWSTRPVSSDIDRQLLRTTALHYPNRHPVKQLEDGTYYWVRRKCLEKTIDEFLCVGFVEEVNPVSKTARMSFPGDRDDCSVSSDGEENFFTISMNSILKKINYMGSL